MTNKIDYFEIGSPDPDASKAFYGTLFDWEIEDPTGPAPYRMVDEARGGLWDTSDMGAANWAIFYVRVEDVQAAERHPPAPSRPGAEPDRRINRPVATASGQDRQRCSRRPPRTTATPRRSCVGPFVPERPQSTAVYSSRLTQASNVVPSPARITSRQHSGTEHTSDKGTVTGAVTMPLA